MDDDTVETRDNQHARWDSFLGELRHLIQQTGLQNQQLARHAEVDPSTVSRWLRSTTPVAWNRLERIIDACIEHIRANDLAPDPAYLADRDHWTASFQQVLAGPQPDGDTPVPPDTEDTPLPEAPAPGSRTPHLTLVVSPLFAMFVVVFVAAVTTLSTVVAAGDTPGTAVTGTPAPTSQTRMYRPDLTERLEPRLPADRGAPRPTLSPPAGHPPAAAQPEISCGIPFRGEGFDLVIIVCTAASVTVLACQPSPHTRYTAPPHARTLRTTCLLIRFNTALSH